MKNSVLMALLGTAKAQFEYGYVCSDNKDEYMAVSKQTEELGEPEACYEYCKKSVEQMDLTQGLCCTHSM